MADENLPAQGNATENNDRPERKSPLTIIKEWSLSRKIALGGLAAISLLLFSILIFQGRTADYQLLYANLSESDAASVVTWLKTEQISYQLKNNGRNIWIPANILHESRLNLAANGLPTGGNVGFEIFDEQSFALTDYVQKVNYLRALQGELSRTISSLSPVDTARVHLALPEKRLFKNQQKSATASVILSIVNGQTLTQKQVKGIIHLVSGSVTGLTEENITIVDSNGVVLDAGSKNDKDMMSVDMLEYQQEVENRFEMRAQALLDKTMGADNAMVRVSATLDFSQVEKTEELFDAEEPVIRSEQVTQEQNGTSTTGGIPGVQSNLQGISPLQGGDTGSSSSTRTTNYEISKTTSKIINPVGTVQSLSVSILVADKKIPATDGNPETTQPRTTEELRSIESMVSAALGLAPDRGDQIQVISMPFTSVPEAALIAQQKPDTFFYHYLPLIKIGLVAFGVLLLYLLLVRPIIKTMRGDVEEHYKTVEAMEQERLETERAKLLEEQEKAEDVAEDPLVVLRREVIADPSATAHILKNWLLET